MVKFKREKVLKLGESRDVSEKIKNAQTLKLKMEKISCYLVAKSSPWTVAHLAPLCMDTWSIT